MSKLLKLKEWVTVPEAARHLSQIMEESVSETDVLQLGLDGHIKLSVYFPNRAKARLGRVIPYEDVPTCEFPSMDGKNTVIYTNGYPLKDLEEGEQIQNDTPFLHFDKEVVSIDGLWDLAMMGNERIDIEFELQQLIHGPEVTMVNIEGTFLNRSDGTWASLQEQLPDRSKGEISPDATKHKAVFYPAGGLGADCTRVVRTSEILALQSKLNGPALERPLANRERETLLTIIAILCKEAKLDYTKWAKTAGAIQRTSVDMDISIGETTIEGHLKKIPDALRTRTK